MDRMWAGEDTATVREVLPGLQRPRPPRIDHCGQDVS